MIHRIDEGLYQTGLMLWTDDHEPPEVDVVLFFAGRDPRMVPGNARTIELLFADDDRGVSDHTFETLREICRDVSSERVLTVCAAGENRSGLASALILHARGRTPREALTRVRDGGRGVVTGRELLWNPGFVAQLLGLSS